MREATGSHQAHTIRNGVRAHALTRVGARSRRYAPVQPPAEGPSARTRVEQPKGSTRKLKVGVKQPKTELLKVRLTPEERAELEARTTRTTMSRFVRNLLRQEGIGSE